MTQSENYPIGLYLIDYLFDAKIILCLLFWNTKIFIKLRYHLEIFYEINYFLNQTCIPRNQI